MSQGIAAETPLTTGLSNAVEEPTSLKSLDEKHIKDLLDRYNRKLVATALGISERTIYRKLKHMGIR